MSDKILALPNKLALLITLICGALITLSFAPFNIWPLAIVSLLVFGLLLKEQHFKNVWWRSFAFGVGFYGAGIHWIYTSIHNFGGASPAFAAFLVFVFACFMALLFCIPFYVYGKWFNYHRFALTLALPACWMLGEWIRTWLLTGFPWLFLGYAHLDTWLAGWAPVSGVISISFFLALTAGVMAEWIWTKSRNPKKKYFAYRTNQSRHFILGYRCRLKKHYLGRTRYKSHHHCHGAAKCRPGNQIKF